MDALVNQTQLWKGSHLSGPLRICFGPDVRSLSCGTNGVFLFLLRGRHLVPRKEFAIDRLAPGSVANEFLPRAVVEDMYQPGVTLGSVLILARRSCPRDPALTRDPFLCIVLGSLVTGSRQRKIHRRIDFFMSFSSFSPVNPSSSEPVQACKKKTGNKRQSHVCFHSSSS